MAPRNRGTYKTSSKRRPRGRPTLSHPTDRHPCTQDPPSVGGPLTASRETPKAGDGGRNQRDVASDLVNWTFRDLETYNMTSLSLISCALKQCSYGFGICVAFHYFHSGGKPTQPPVGASFKVSNCFCRTSVERACFKLLPRTSFLKKQNLHNPNNTSILFFVKVFWKSNTVDFGC